MDLDRDRERVSGKEAYDAVTAGRPNRETAAAAAIAKPLSLVAEADGAPFLISDSLAVWFRFCDWRVVAQSHHRPVPSAQLRP